MSGTPRGSPIFPRRHSPSCTSSPDGDPPACHARRWRPADDRGGARGAVEKVAKAPRLARRGGRVPDRQVAARGCARPSGEGARRRQALGAVARPGTEPRKPGLVDHPHAISDAERAFIEKSEEKARAERRRKTRNRIALAASLVALLAGAGIVLMQVQAARREEPGAATRRRCDSACLPVRRVPRRERRSECPAHGGQGRGDALDARDAVGAAAEPARAVPASFREPHGA